MLPSSRSFASRLGFVTALAALSVSLTSPTAAQAKSTGEWIIGTVDLLEIDNPNDVFSGGKMVISGQVIILPRNLLIDLPANRLTLQQLFAQAPAESLAVGESGLATLDASHAIGAIADVRANRNSFGNVIAGDVIIEKGAETVQGTVTHINHTDGYLRVDGIPGDDTTGLMVRINDPDGRYTIQSGKGCDGGPNCSPDPRFAVDPDNYTITFATGYPATIPSTVRVGLRPGFRAGDNPAAASDANGVGDPFAPVTNRTSNPVLDATRFAPIRVGDAVLASGNFEQIGGEFFLSCHSLTVSAKLTTRDDPTQPDYIIWDEVEWHVGSFENQRVKLLAIGFSTLPNSQVDIFGLHVNPRTNANNEIIVASTVNNPDTVNHGVGAGAAGIFKIQYDVDFLTPVDGRRSPCSNLTNAGFSPCATATGTLAENFSLLSPVPRELIGRTRRTPALLPGIITRDINGNQAPNGEYLTPVGIGYPEFVEIDLARVQEPYSFDGLPWTLDRRLSPGGCGDIPCGNIARPLDPFPFSGVDVGSLAPVPSRIFAFFPFGPANFLAPAPAPGPLPILPTPRPNLGPPAAPAAPVANFTAGSTGGVAPVSIAFTDTSTGTVNARLWDFGDGSFSILQNPVHTFTTAGTFNVSLTALGLGGVNTNTKLGLVNVTPPGGPGAPTAAFSQDRTAGNTPLTVNFTNLTTGNATSFLWNFGDGATSTATSPSHIYTVAGLYTVTLTATGPGGTNAASRVDAVRANTPGAVDIDFRGTPRSGAAGLVVRFRTQVLAGAGTGITGTWEFGDGSTAPANGQDILHTYATAGLYTVTLTATNGTSTDIEQKVNYITVTAPLVIR